MAEIFSPHMKEGTVCLPNALEYVDIPAWVSGEEHRRIGQLLQEARESREVLQSEMNESCGLSKNDISAVERGVSKASIDMLLSYCDRLKMTPNEILGIDKDNILPELKSVSDTETGTRNIKRKWISK